MLQLEKENISAYQASFLDLSVIVEKKKKSKSQLFNKRDAFLSSIVRMLHLDWNILFIYRLWNFKV